MNTINVPIPTWPLSLSLNIMLYGFRASRPCGASANNILTEQNLFIKTAYQNIGFDNKFHRYDTVATVQLSLVDFSVYQLIRSL